MAEEDNPLVSALPPATDYLSYLTLLEYQLTPARLPTLHNLLQDETLTTNIGWDLVQLLLPMLPDSLECLQDIARLGNPREVILRVSDALMKLQPDEDEEEQVELQPTTADTQEEEEDQTKPLPRHVLTFNSLIAMLSVLHARIKTKSPSRFLATSLQAALEAYTLMPTSETTMSLLEFFRDVSPTKRPATPARAPSESSLLRVSEMSSSAPDPEAEEQSHAPPAAGSDESELLKRFLQFALIEVLKSYLLSLAGPTDPGMSWTIRLQERLQPEKRVVAQESQTELYANSKPLRERDMIMAKITALSRDFGLDDNQLLEIVFQSPETRPPPLDFDEPPKKAEEIPLERHGALLLLAARAAMAELFSYRQVTPIAVFPDLARIFSHFLGNHDTPDEVAFGQPQALLDSLLTLTVFSMQKAIGEPATEAEFQEFVLSLAACTARQSYGTVRQIPGVIVHSNPSEVARYKLIRRVFEDSKLQTLKDSAIGWLKDGILNASASKSSDSIFLDSNYFSVLFPSLFDSSSLFLSVTADEIVPSWISFSQTLTPAIHAALSLYYILISSSTLRAQLHLEKTYIYFRNRFLEPLKSLCHAFEADMSANGGEGRIEAAVGESMCRVGMARSVGLVGLVVEQVEEVVGDVFDEGKLGEPSADDIARVDRIRRETAA